MGLPLIGRQQMTRFNKWIVPFAPALIAFGPLFVAMGVTGPFHRTSLVGALASSVGTLILFIKIQALERQIEKLRRDTGTPPSKAN